MDFQEASKNIKGSATKVIIIAFIIEAIGGGMIFSSLIEEDGVNIALCIVGGIFSALGLLIILRTLSSTINNPVLKAIKEGDKDFLVWVYNKQINTTAGHGGQTLGTSQNVCMFYKNGKSLEINLNKKTNPADFVSYLASEFPNALVGYADATREKASELLGKKV